MFTSLDCLIVSNERSIEVSLYIALIEPWRVLRKQGHPLAYACQSFLPLPLKCLPPFFLPRLFPDHGTQTGSSKFFRDTHKSLHKTPVQGERSEVQGHLCQKGLKTDQPRLVSSQKNQVCSPPLSALLAGTDLTPRLEEMLTCNFTSHHSQGKE